MLRCLAFFTSIFSISTEDIDAPQWSDFATRSSHEASSHHADSKLVTSPCSITTFNLIVGRSNFRETAIPEFIDR